jgi:pyridoxamine 5'-phosphate oxidase family protein
LPQWRPVGWIYNAASDTIDVGGHELERSKKFRGRAEAIALPTLLIRIHPERSPAEPEPRHLDGAP